MRQEPPLSKFLPIHTPPGRSSRGGPHQFWQMTPSEVPTPAKTAARRRRSPLGRPPPEGGPKGEAEAQERRPEEGANPPSGGGGSRHRPRLPEKGFGETAPSGKFTTKEGNIEDFRNLISAGSIISHIMRLIVFLESGSEKALGTAAKSSSRRFH